MNLIRKYTEKAAITKQKNIEEEAKNRITLSEYKGEVFIAFDGYPLVLIDNSEQVPQITEKLNGVRNSFIKYRTDENTI